MAESHMEQARDALEKASKYAQEALAATETAQEKLGTAAQQEGELGVPSSSKVEHYHDDARKARSAEALGDADTPFSAPDVVGIDTGGGGGSARGGNTTD